MKTLRLYDQLGLLKPVYIDENTGYRYYEPDQLDTMIAIQRYKRFGFTLDEIKTMLDRPAKENVDTLLVKQAALLVQKRELEMALRDLHILIERLERKEEMTQNTFENYTIDELEQKPLPVYGLRKTMGIGDFGTAYSEIFEKLYQNGVKDFGLTGSRYFDQEFDEGASDIEVFVEVDPALANDTIEGGTMIHTTHTGPYSGLPEAYAAIVKWMEANGYEQAGAPYELYTKCGMNQFPVDQWETDIYFLARKKGE